MYMYVRSCESLRKKQKLNEAELTKQAQTPNCLTKMGQEKWRIEKEFGIGS